MASVLFFEPRARLGEVLAERLRASPAVAACALAAGPEGEAGIAYDTVVYQPPASGRRTAVPDLAHARRVLSACAARRVRQVVLL